MRRLASTRVSGWVLGARLFTAAGSLLSGVVLLSAVACSGEMNGPGLAPDPLASASAFCDAFSKTVCSEAVAKACDGKVDECAVQQAAYCRKYVTSAGYARTVTRDNVRVVAENCLEEARAAYGDNEITVEEREAVLLFKSGKCGAIAGNSKDPLGTGATCVNSSECAAGLTCVDGTCTTVQLLAPGDACGSDKTKQCREGYFCDSTCKVRRDLSDDCSSDAACKSGLVCSITAPATTGKCIARTPGAMGAPCDADRLCESALDCIEGICGKTVGKLDPCTSDAECAGALFCSRICLEKIQLAATEEHCKTLRAP